MYLFFLRSGDRTICNIKYELSFLTLPLRFSIGRWDLGHNSLSNYTYIVFVHWLLDWFIQLTPPDMKANLIGQCFQQYVKSNDIKAIH